MITRLLILLAVLRVRLAYRDETGAASLGWLGKLFSEPNLLLGAIAGFVNMLVLLGVWDLTGEQTGGVNLFFAALVALITAVVTRSSEVVARQEHTDGPVTAGPAAQSQWGIVKGTTVTVDAVPPGTIPPADPLERAH